MFATEKVHTQFVSVQTKSLNLLRFKNQML